MKARIGLAARSRYTTFCLIRPRPQIRKTTQNQVQSEITRSSGCVLQPGGRRFESCPRYFATHERPVTYGGPSSLDDLRSTSRVCIGLGWVRCHGQWRADNLGQGKRGASYPFTHGRSPRTQAFKSVDRDQDRDKWEVQTRKRRRDQAGRCCCLAVDGCSEKQSKAVTLKTRGHDNSLEAAVKPANQFYAPRRGLRTFENQYRNRRNFCTKSR